MQHLFVPETKNGEALRPKPLVSPFVIGRVSMLAPIEFDDDPMSIADEVADVSTDRFLPSELRWNVATDENPEERLGTGELSSKLLRPSLGERMPRKPWHARKMAFGSCPNQSPRFLSSPSGGFVSSPSGGGGSAARR